MFVASLSGFDNRVLARVQPKQDPGGTLRMNMSARKRERERQRERQRDRETERDRE